MLMPEITSRNPALLDQMRQSAAPLANQAVAQLMETEGREEARRLFGLLIRRNEMPLDKLPASLRDYWAATRQLPDWVDRQQVV